MASTCSSIGTCTLTMPEEVPNGASDSSSEMAMLRLYIAIAGDATGAKVLVSMVPTGFLVDYIVSCCVFIKAVHAIVAGEEKKIMNICSILRRISKGLLGFKVLGDLDVAQTWQLMARLAFQKPC